MTRLPNVRPLLLAAGGVALVGSLLGARLLGPGGGGGTDTSKAPPPPAGKDGAGTVVLGTADSDPQPARYGLPTVLQSGEVVDVYVHQNQAVKAGDKLYRFDSTMLEQELKGAESALAVARAKADTARGAAAQHAKKVDLQKQVVAAFEAQTKLALEAWRLGDYNFTEGLKAQGVTQDKWEERRKNDVKLYELYADHEAKKVKTAIEKATLTDLEAAKENQVDKLIAEADAEVKRYEGLVKKAETAIALCTVTARQDGTIERVSISKGDTIGIGVHNPLVVLIPAGPRVIRGEVEGEFAHKIGTNQKGRAVTVQDYTDPKVTYQGVVRDLGNSFLPRRANEGALVQNETRVLEVIIDVANPAPPGKPPLRVGTKVRVVFAP